MSTLFNNNTAEGGYRLRSLEIYNWGTFHGKIYKLQPNGRTSLLTGANGSGKTTLIDALLTLMVPSNKRFYNQSSGAESKKERDENSYFWGYYGKTYSDQDERSKMEQLRNKNENPYSVLLACFQNSATLHTITLVQVRWYSGGAIKKVYIVSPYPLTIHEHFGEGRFDVKGEWKRKLLKQFPKTDLFESFKDYAARFSDLFGLKEKALPLFNQTVGIKVLGDLTQFIRQQMLEEPDGEEQFKGLYSHYTDLLISYRAIQKDEKQLQLLLPIVESKEALDLLKQDLTRLLFIQEQAAPYLNKREYELLDTHIANLDKQIAFFKSEKDRTEAEIKQLEGEKDQLITQKALLNIDNQILLLNKDVSTETDNRDRKKRLFEEYLKVAKILGLQVDVDETSFLENQEKAIALQKSLQEELDVLTDKRARYKIDIDATGQKIELLQEDITSLLGRKNRIPRELIAVRQKLTDLLETSENELPFVGELIKVKDDCRHWEDAIERVLHSFSMQLLVPEKFIRQINHFVHTHDLQIKLVYQKIEKRPSDTLLRWPTDNDSLLNKIDIKEIDTYSTWLERQLVERFNFYCTDDLDVFYGSPKAITSNGLIRNVNRHEKDDRPQSWDKQKYRLGWDNKETVRFLQEKKYHLEKQHGHLFEEIRALQPRMEEIKQLQPLFTGLATIKSFSEIHWHVHAEKIQELNGQIEKLTTSNDKYQTIVDQLAIVEGELKVKKEAKDKYLGEINRRDQDHIDKNRRKLNLRFDDLTEIGQQQIEAFLLSESLNGSGVANLDQLDGFKKVLLTTISKRHTAAFKAVEDKKLQTLTHIAAFVHPEAKILHDFPDWSGDVINIKPDLDSLNELEDLCKVIRNQRLVEHKRRFQEYMDRSMLDALTNFRAWLYNEEEKIGDIIEELNVPLKRITFNKNPDTYLQLECKPTRDQEIKAFKEQLSATIPNTLEFATQKDDSYRLAVFEKIKTLITDLQKEEAWRRKVTDIRN